MHERDPEIGLYLPDRRIIHPRGFNPRLERPRAAASQQMMIAQNISSAPPSEQPFLVGETGGGADLATSSGQEFGYQFVVGSAPITITQLGLKVTSGAYTDHVVKLYDSDGLTVLNTVTIPFASMTPGAVAYVAITPRTLAVGVLRHIRIVIVSGFNGFRGGAGYLWLSSTTDATIVTESDETGTNTSHTSGYADFKYTL